MSSQTFPRSFLQSMIERGRHEQIDHVIQTFMKQLLWVEGQGYTQYVYHPSSLHQKVTMPYLTSQQMLLGLRLRFPECKVYWAECEERCDIYKRGIVIDWA